MHIGELQKISKKIREHVVKMAHEAKSAHTAPALSCTDILVALYFHVMKEEDSFILSKGHGCMSYYAVLAERGFFSLENLYSYGKNGGNLAEHPSCETPGIDVHTGSLGHGLSIATGRALARKIKNKTGREFVLLSDGECNEGSVWEAASFAAQKRLGNVVAIIDHNKLQATDKCKYINNINLIEVFKAFGWYTIRVDGHNFNDLIWALTQKNKICSHLPLVVVADTIKGKGVSFMENNLEWHYRFPNGEELNLALREIQKQKLL